MHQRSEPGTCSTEWWPVPVATAGSCSRIRPMRRNGPYRFVDTTRFSSSNQLRTMLIWVTGCGSG